MDDVNTQELRIIKLDILDRLEGYDIKPKDLYAYDSDVRAVACMPSKKREAQLNRLVSKIRSTSKKKARGGKG